MESNSFMAAEKKEKKREINGKYNKDIKTGKKALKIYHRQKISLTKIT